MKIGRSGVRIQLATLRNFGKFVYPTVFECVFRKRNYNISFASRVYGRGSTILSIMSAETHFETLPTLGEVKQNH